MTVADILSPLPLACPDCGSKLDVQDGKIVCALGHPAGLIEGGVPNFAAPRTGVEGDLVEFWSTSEVYYDAAGGANADLSDADHAIHRRVLGILQDRQARLVLDVGCGTGEFSVPLAERAPEARYVGVDVSRLAPRRALELGRPGAFLVADAEQLPFRSGAFDAVLSFYALEHFSRPEETLAEMARVLAPGGVLALVSVSYDRPLGIIPSVRFGLSRGGRRLPRLHPANLAVYAANRGRFALRQAVKQLRYALDPSYTSFELVRRPLALDIGYQSLSDYDAVHVVSGRSVGRFLEQRGLRTLETNLPPRPSLRIPFSFWLVAERPSSA